MRLAIIFLTVLIGSPAFAQSGDIVVTGEKRPVQLQQTQTSIALYTHEAIADRAVRDTAELYDRTVNLSPAFGGSGFSIRGITNIGVTGGGEASTATIYLDGVPLASTFLQGAPLQLWDAAQVEIFRGPQSTLQGINSLAGAIVISSEDAAIDRWQSRGRLIFTDEPQTRASAAVGGPLIRDQLAVRLSADAQNRDGTIWNSTRNTSEARESSATIRSKLLWRPQNLNGLEVRAGFVHAEREGPYYTVYARTDIPDFLDHRIATDNVPNITSVRFDSANIDLRYELTDGLRIMNEGTWGRVRETSQFDGDYGPANLAYSNQQRIYRTVTQEIRVIANTPRLSGVLGVYFFDRNLQSRTVSRTAVPTPTATIAAFLRGSGASPQLANGIAQSYSAALPSIGVDFSGDFPTHIQTYASFGDARLRLTPRFSLLLGFRAEREINDAQTIQTSSFAGAYPDPLGFGSLATIINQINAAVGGLVSQANGTLPPSHRTFDSFLPKMGLAVRLSQDAEASFVVQKAYRSGGTSANIARGQSFAYDPETTWNYEASLRSRLFRDKLRLNANAFYVDWTQQQVAVNFGLNAYDVHTVNAGKSHLYGFEIDADYLIRPSWTAYLALGHVRTRFDLFTVQSGGVPSNLSGSEFAFAPRWTASGGTDIRLKGGWGGSVNGAYSSRSFGAPGANQTSYRIAPHLIANMKIGYRAQTWSMHLTGTNIFDRRYVAYKNPSENRAVINTPRIIGIELAAQY